MRLPFLPEDTRIIDSTGALELAQVPQRLLMLGGIIIGLEIAQVYHALGSRVTIAERLDQIIPGANKDIVKPLMTRIAARYEAVHLETSVTAVAAGEALVVSFEGKAGTWQAEYDAILLAVGRRPNGAGLEAKAASVTACGHKAAFDPVAIPSVAYTDPKIAGPGRPRRRPKPRPARSASNASPGRPRGGRCRWAGPRG